MRGQLMICLIAIGDTLSEREPGKDVLAMRGNNDEPNYRPASYIPKLLDASAQAC